MTFQQGKSCSYSRFDYYLYIKFIMFPQCLHLLMFCTAFNVSPPNLIVYMSQTFCYWMHIHLLICSFNLGNLSKCQPQSLKSVKTLNWPEKQPCWVTTKLQVSIIRELCNKFTAFYQLLLIPLTREDGRV